MPKLLLVTAPTTLATAQAWHAMPNCSCVRSGRMRKHGLRCGGWPGVGSRRQRGHNSRQPDSGQSGQHECIGGQIPACPGFMQKAIDFARSKGSVVVSAGNSSNASDRQLPANCSGVIAVAANNRQGGRSSYSNFGRVVDVAAPSDEAQPTADRIVMASNVGTTSPARQAFVTNIGTSFAARMSRPLRRCFTKRDRPARRTRSKWRCTINFPKAGTWHIGIHPVSTSRNNRSSVPAGSEAFKHSPGKRTGAMPAGCPSMSGRPEWSEGLRQAATSGANRANNQSICGQPPSCFVRPSSPPHRSPQLPPLRKATRITGEPAFI
jgi:hypothetical protein